MTYEAILQRAPLSSAAGKLAVAGEYVVFLTTIIEGDKETMRQLSESQQRYLYKLREKWRLRASGLDTRWNDYGSRPGRPVVDKAPSKSRRRDPGESDPLFQSLMQKYGTPCTDGIVD